MVIKKRIGWVKLRKKVGVVLRASACSSTAQVTTIFAFPFRFLSPKSIFPSQKLDV